MSGLFITVKGNTLRLLVTLRLLQPMYTKSLAFRRLQSRLFQIPGVAALAIQGFLRSGRSAAKRGEHDVMVLTDCFPSAELCEDVKVLVAQINASYGTDLKVGVMQRADPNH